MNKTFVYDYDEYGNLIYRKQYNYTLNDLENNSYTEKNFSYTNSNKNKLSTYDNKTLLYDSEGKLTDYNGFVYSWDKKFLTQISSKPNIIKAISFSPIKTYTFTYNSNGQRTRMFYSRSIPSSEIVPINPNEMISLSKAFHYDNFGRLVSEGRTETYVDSSFISSQIDYLYCENDIIGFDHTRDGNTSRYYFEKNLQNDVIAIYDLNGNLKVKYNYDAWGNCSLGSETTDSTLANTNPIRYRSYYYDVETQLYWVSSRYYSPELCRFISPDSVDYLEPSSINGLNLYSYANNNPIGIAYRSSGSDASGGMVSSIASSVGGLNSGYHGTISNSSNILGALGTLSTAFGLFDQWSGYLSGGLDAGLAYWGPKGFGFQFLGKYSSALKKFGIGMTIAGNVLSWGSSVYNNFNNPNYSTGEAIGASFMDAAYYTGKGFGTYWLGSKVGELAVTAGIAAGSAALGATAFGTTIGFVGAFAIGGGVAVLVGSAGAVAIYYLGEWIDDGWEWLKKQIFE